MVTKTGSLFPTGTAAKRPKNTSGEKTQKHVSLRTRPSWRLPKTVHIPTSLPGPVHTHRKNRTRPDPSWRPETASEAVCRSVKGARRRALREPHEIKQDGRGSGTESPRTENEMGRGGGGVGVRRRPPPDSVSGGGEWGGDVARMTTTTTVFGECWGSPRFSRDGPRWPCRPWMARPCPPAAGTGERGLPATPGRPATRVRPPPAGRRPAGAGPPPRPPLGAAIAVATTTTGRAGRPPRRRGR